MSTNVSMESTEKLVIPSQRKGWSFKRKLLVFGGAALVVIIALAVGLGVGLTRHKNDDDSDSDNSGSGNGNGGNSGGGTTNPTDPSNDNTTSTDNGTMWQPAVGVTWQYVLKWGLNSTMPNNTAVWDIDLFDNNKTIISGLQQNNAKVICYFSAGSYEDWRSDKDKFSANDMGKELDGWPGEKWLNVSSPTVRSVMTSRLDLAKSKGCNAVDPDNMDGYDNDNGLGLTKAQAIDYTKWLAAQAHSRGMSMGLKNAGSIIPDVLSSVQFSVNEQCHQYKECSTYAAFIAAGKPVFNVEYPKGTKVNNQQNVQTATVNSFCSNTDSKGFSVIVKNMILDLWKQTC